MPLNPRKRRPIGRQGATPPHPAVPVRRVQPAGCGCLMNVTNRTTTSLWRLIP